MTKKAMYYYQDYLSSSLDWECSLRKGIPKTDKLYTLTGINVGHISKSEWYTKIDSKLLEILYL